METVNRIPRISIVSRRLALIDPRKRHIAISLIQIRQRFLALTAVIRLLHKPHAIPQEIRIRVTAIELPDPPAERVVLEMRSRDSKPVLRHDGLELVPIVVFKRELFSRPMPTELANQPTINVILEALVLEHLEPVVLDVATRVIARHQVGRRIPAKHFRRQSRPSRLFDTPCRVIPIARRAITLIALLDHIARCIVLPLLRKQLAARRTTLRSLPRTAPDRVVSEVTRQLALRP
ncbi:hypothetical protein WK03_32025 [Burkholderia cepacia]|nr:hypothetical protein WK03_32025 [Burkholderia cepacia]